MNFKIRNIAFYLFTASAILACSEKTPEPMPEDEKKSEEFIIMADSIVFAVIGDYGIAGVGEELVSKLVKSWKPDFILTTGDNNYPSGLMTTMEENISQYYGDYIFNFDAQEDYRCNGKAFEDSINRFFPCPGNHDSYNADSLNPYLDFFSLPYKELYYKFQWGPVSFFSINSVAVNINEQRKWFEEEIAKSTSLFNIVYFHHPPYTTGTRGNEVKMQWNFYELGVDIVLCGHDHLYSRIELASEPGLIYLVNGLGGRNFYDCSTAFLPPDTTTAICYNESFGAMKATANSHKLEIKFYSVEDSGVAVDSVVVFK
ncbi:MAG: metallophosphoesterase [Bacteroidales bacterium]|nr:metallophosphoesterase [Bacteroidales bacterium]MCF8390922.1 metallophosphoesterase [Bacteroidales bacterium]